MLLKPIDILEMLSLVKILITITQWINTINNLEKEKILDLAE